MALTTSIEEIIIYESPDGGKTVYARKSGQKERTLVTENALEHWNSQWLVWREILKLSYTEPTLADAINKAEMIYTLINSKDN